MQIILLLLLFPIVILLFKLLIATHEKNDIHSERQKQFDELLEINKQLQETINSLLKTK